MRTFSTIVIFILAGVFLSINYVSGNPTGSTTQTPRIPRIRFAGDPFAQMATTVFTETLNDMLSKVEYGDNPNPKYCAGFFHTSTDSMGIPNYYRAMWARDCGRGVIEILSSGICG